MYRYIVAFALFTPLIGIFLVERGEHAVSVGLDGHPNGATIAFAAYCAVVITVAFVMARGITFAPPRRRLGSSAAAIQPSVGTDGNAAFVQFAKRLIVVNVFSLLLILFGFGGIRVWLGMIDKGTFRSTLGVFGSVPFLLTKFVLPALFAYATTKYMRTTRANRSRALWWTNLMLVFAIGASWGYKTTSMTMLLPALLLIYWRMNLRQLVSVAFAGVAVLVLYFYWFDSRALAAIGDVNVAQILWLRLTVLQGDVAWHVWGLYTTAEVFPKYAPTLAAALGDRLLAGFGVSQSDLSQWMGYHYDWIINQVANLPVESTVGGHSISGTPFSEGLIAGGLLGVGIFAVIAGALVGVLYRRLTLSIAAGTDRRTALLATYFCFNLFSWLSGGAITQLFHVSVWTNVGLTLLLLRFMDGGLRGFRRVAGGSVAIAAPTVAHAVDRDHRT